MPDPALTEHVDWLRRRRLSEETIRIRVSVLRRIGEHTGRLLLETTPAELEAWERSLAVADASRGAYLTQIRAFYAWALVHGRIERDPSVNLVSPRLAHRKPRPISEPDLAMAMMTAPARIAPWLALAAYAGFRAGEVSRLTREDVHDELTSPVLVVQGKGAKERVVPMAVRVWQALQVHGMPAEGFIFGRLDGEPGPVPPYRVSQLSSAHMHSIGVGATLHQLRHRFLTEIYRSTKDLRLTQELAGHSSPVTTAGYAAWSPDAAALAVTALDRRSA